MRKVARQKITFADNKLLRTEGQAALGHIRSCGDERLGRWRGLQAAHDAAEDQQKLRDE
jgi:hypothetical protein